MYRIPSILLEHEYLPISTSLLTFLSVIFIRSMEEWVKTVD